MKTLLKISLTVMTVSSLVQAAPQWIDPPKEICNSNGGGIAKNGVCQANFLRAVGICFQLGGQLPTIEQLRNEIESCGGVINSRNNENDQAYQSCYKNKGFIPKAFYWSSSFMSSGSTTHIKMAPSVWGAYLDNGNDGVISGSESISVRCVK